MMNVPFSGPPHIGGSPMTDELRHRTRRAKAVGLVLLAAIIVAICLAPRAWQWMCGNHPITFYGRVVDEQGRPMSGVRVEAHIVYAPGLTLPVMYGRAERAMTLRLVTDADGRFQFSNVFGHGLSLRGFSRNQRGRESIIVHGISIERHQPHQSPRRIESPTSDLRPPTSDLRPLNPEPLHPHRRAPLPRLHPIKQKPSQVANKSCPHASYYQNAPPWPNPTRLPDPADPHAIPRTHGDQPCRPDQGCRIPPISPLSRPTFTPQGV
jgi:hypothetical protein